MKRFAPRPNPWQELFVSFLLLILGGMLLLKLPFVIHRDGLSWLDALFTSTSAVCVTGLVTVPTSGFNLWGQWVILLLIQAGAIGIMTLTSSFLLAFRRPLDLKHKWMFLQWQGGESLSGAHTVLKNILKITFITEFAGAVLLTAGFRLDGFSWSSAVYNGIFHSISAFCNAGFSTFDDSLMHANALIKWTVAALIVIGGLGYFVIIDLLMHFPRRKISLHSHIVLVTSLVLILTGAVFFYMTENPLSAVDAVFQSVTARTAGFNTVDLRLWGNASIFLLTILMYIGASPGSTGGGIKTTNFFIMIYAVFSVLKGKQSVVYRYRTISGRLILRAFGTAVVYFIFLAAGILILMETEQAGFKEILFEAVSAMGTVGLSLGITPALSGTGKVVIIILMFTGRLGPASFALATLSRKKEIEITYPEAEIY